MEEATKKHKINFLLLLACILCCAFGVLILIYYKQTSYILTYFFGALVFLCGLISLLTYSFRKDPPPVFSLTGLSVGLTLMTIGGCAFLFPNSFIDFLPVLISSLIVFLGYGAIHASIYLIKCKSKAWFIMMLFGLITVAVGVYAISGKMTNADVMFISLALILCLDSVSIAIVHFVYVARRNAYLDAANIVTESIAYGTDAAAVPEEEKDAPVATADASEKAE